MVERNTVRRARETREVGNARARDAMEGRARRARWEAAAFEAGTVFMSFVGISDEWYVFK